MFSNISLSQVPATREVLGSLPNVFSALCLNARGLHSFVQCQPFERLFKVLLSPDYLPAMRRRRSSDPLGKLDCLCCVIHIFTSQTCMSRWYIFGLATGDTASNLGSAVDELMRHQPTLKTDATTAIIKVFYFGLQAFFQVLPHVLVGKLKINWCYSYWRRSVTLVEPLSTSARNHLFRRQMALWRCPRHAPATLLKKLQVRMKRKRRPSTPSASSRGNQRATDSQCHLNCMTLSS